MLRAFVGNALRRSVSANLIDKAQLFKPKQLLVNSALSGNSSFLQCFNFSTFSMNNVNSLLPSMHHLKTVPTTTSLLQSHASVSLQQPITRSVTKFSLNKGKRKSVKAVVKRFKRLDWGIWIRTRSGRHKKLFKKSAARRIRLRQHVFTNATQSWLLDKMVTSFWRRPKYYIDDPYTPYHTRDEYHVTKRKTFKV